MDLERVEQYVVRCPLQELEYHHASGVYTLGNSHTKPAWWSIGYRATEHSPWALQTCRGLTTAMALIEQKYPVFYAWLVCRFPDTSHDWLTGEI